MNSLELVYVWGEQIAGVWWILWETNFSSLSQSKEMKTLLGKNFHVWEGRLVEKCLPGIGSCLEGGTCLSFLWCLCWCLILMKYICIMDEVIRMYYYNSSSVQKMHKTSLIERKDGKKEGRNWISCRFWTNKLHTRHRRSLHLICFFTNEHWKL